MRKPVLVCISTLVCFSLAACSRVASQNPALQDISEDRLMISKVVKIETSVTDKRQSTWKVEAARVSGQEALNVSSFINETDGWVAGKGALYKTTDGGETWQKVEIGIPKEARVSAISFVSRNLGWVVVQQLGPYSAKYDENHFWVMRTDNGGQSWQLQDEDNEAEITHISFINEREGWLVGIKYLGTAPLRSTFLIRYTSDQGLHWTDASGDLNRVAVNTRGFISSGWVIDILAEDPQIATILTREWILKTYDAGHKWERVAPINDWPQSFRRLGAKEDKRLWVAGGAYSIEGIWGKIAVEEENDLWKEYGLGGIYLADVLFLSENQVFACGSQPIEKGADTLDRWLSEGVILYSSDGGRNWSIIYRNREVKSINALATVDATHLWAVGEGGLIIRLEPATINTIGK